MPKNKKPAGGRPAKNFDPSYARKSGGPAGTTTGSRSPGHRGFRAVEGDAPKKARWNADERAARRHSDEPREQRAPRDDRYDGGSSASRSERPAYNRGENRNERPAYNRGENRSERPAYGRTERPAYGRDERAPRGERTERPAYGRDERERPAYGRGDRNERPAYNRGENRTERPAYNRDDRAPRGDRAERPAYNRGENRTERPAYNRGENRTERPSYNRGENRTERPSYNRDERAPRGDRAERPAYNRGDRTERPSYNNDRPFTRGQRIERPSTGRVSRDERAPRRDSNFDRPRRDAGVDKNFYPNRDAKGHFTPEDDVVLERLEAQATLAIDVEGVSFSDLGLGGNIVAALAELGAPSPFPIQAATIPDVIAGKDVLGRGRTGSGKTIAFGAPLVEKLMENGGGKKRAMGRKPRALILAPTRELALQIDRTVQPIARSVGLFTTQIYGGVPQNRQVGALQRGVDIIVGTPGRIEDLIEQGRLDLSEVTITVLDEADHMCDLGFLEPVQRILRLTANGGQKLLFSATLDKGVASLVKEFLPSPAVHEVAGEDQASATIDHRVLVVEHRDKDRIIEELANRNEKTLIFSRTRAYAERLADQLEDAGIRAVSLHGDLNQARRTRNLAQLTSGRVNVLVATDVAARGIHVDDITLVIQADAPDEYKTYLHRSGRTGRAGKEGVVVTIIPKARQRRMTELLGRAEIEADYVNARPGDEIIEELAGHMTNAKLTA
ncbi:superfamily II DNA/RNA helicase [Okibacterium sp. HSC-33S16]|uniref:DEAD/DEAH box helicase n=1 Tax=Okibacterium sp. HSC-33S16 TaxID=2910965 RepID=UPI00209F385F|nr:DEAD/DEAH box helicase [Okibacterium sp. HSC-33S16]MCP2031517.1 superfamily II DNA/RNA helicase [Okibacterium sp. HSC-33S16]